MKPFKSDGCSVIGPIVRFFGYRNEKIRDCCIEHDKAYYFGGPIRDKFKADSKFRHCLIEEAGLSRIAAGFMWIGVVIGGFIPHPSFKWGFGK